ncbi:putative Fe-S oxidoreductase [Thaumarchaeota archaeon SCGC AB-539-E09]|nr:putative Fe-S oxidoreductase [Thaumarchaeota archaeon SCGC AB-539-E09]
MIRSLLQLPPNILSYKLSRSINLRPPLPINITVSLTNVCNSRCKTCFIWKHYIDNPEQKEKEFKTWEFERTFRSLGDKAIWFTLSGGEPFLRDDMVEICTLAYEICTPQIITIPTNCLLPDIIEKKTRQILEKCSDVKLIINLSLDGIGDKHDELRGVNNNFTQVLNTFQQLNKIKKDFQNLNIGVHSVISKFNVNHIEQIYNYVKKLDPDSYISEIAENRTELFNMDKDIAPNSVTYEKTINRISDNISWDSTTKNTMSKLIQNFRKKYYDLVVKEQTLKRQVIPCYAGYASCHITPYGDVWPCCVLGYDKPMGNLREFGYDFKKIWFSEQADEVRKFIKEGNCYCPLANAHYTNILCNFRSVLDILGSMIGSYV